MQPLLKYAAYVEAPGNETAYRVHWHAGRGQRAVRYFFFGIAEAMLELELLKEGPRHPLRHPRADVSLTDCELVPTSVGIGIYNDTGSRPDALPRDRVTTLTAFRTAGPYLNMLLRIYPDYYLEDIGAFIDAMLAGYELGQKPDFPGFVLGETTPEWQSRFPEFVRLHWDDRIVEFGKKARGVI